MGAAESFPELLIDSKSLAFHLAPGAAHAFMFPLTALYREKLRQYNSSAAHAIEISIKALGGSLSAIELTRDSIHGQLVERRQQPSREVTIRLTGQNTNNFEVADYFLQIHSGVEAAKLLMAARVVEETSEAGQTARVRSLTALPAPAMSTQPVHVQQPRASVAAQKAIDLPTIRSDGPSAAHSHSGRSVSHSISSALSSISSFLMPAEARASLATGTSASTGFRLRIDEKSLAFQIPPQQFRWVEFSLLPSYQAKLKHYNATAPHSISLTIKVLHGELYEACVYRSNSANPATAFLDATSGGSKAGNENEAPSGLIDTVNSVADTWIYLIKGELTKDWEPATYFLKLSTSEETCKLVISANIVQEYADEKTGEWFFKNRSMTALPDGPAVPEWFSEGQRKASMAAGKQPNAAPAIQPSAAPRASTFHQQRASIAQAAFQNFGNPLTNATASAASASGPSASAVTGAGASTVSGRSSVIGPGASSVLGGALSRGSIVGTGLELSDMKKAIPVTPVRSDQLQFADREIR